MNRLLGYRKVLVTFVCFATSVILLLYNKLTGDQFVSFNQFLLPAFLASNLLETFMNRRGQEKRIEG